MSALVVMRPFAAAAFFIAASSWGQEISRPLVRPAVKAKTASEHTRDLAAVRPLQAWSEGDPVREKDDLRATGPAMGTERAKQPDALLKRENGARRAAAAVPAKIGASFAGIPSTGWVPPDAIGAVGPKHYIQMVNSAFAIYDKQGKLLAGPAEINSLWKGFGGPCEKDNDGDPVARYDHLADRWLVSQFALDDYMQCIAISRGPDPVSSGWYLYAFPTLDASGKKVSSDYPKLGIWPDAYYMSTQRGFPDGGIDVWAFEREQMLAGKPARQVQFAVGAPSIVLQPSDLNGKAPAAGTPNFFIRPMDGKRFGGDDRIEIYAFTVDWKKPASSTFKSLSRLNTTAFDSVLCSNDLNGACVPQPNTTVKLETLSVWPMFRAQYRNFDSYETLLLNHTVNADGKGTAGIRWYELRRENGKAWSIYQEGTYSPDETHRWMGSMAMDGAGNIALGYSVADQKTYPGLRVAIRRASAAKATFESETVVKDGGGSQTYGKSRWGDYASMDVDPDRPCTFWYTSLYYDKTSVAGWKTWIAEIQAPSCNK